MKKESIKLNIKNQEKYMFQRVTFSYLAEAVQKKFDLPSKIQKEVQENQNHFQQRKRQTDGIFFDQSKSDQNKAQIGNDMFEDILQQCDIVQNNVSIRQKKKDENNNEKEINIEPIESYINEIQQIQQTKYKFKTVNRKLCLKKINQNLRKRLKSKNNNEDIPQRSLSSATVAITNVINLQAQPKIGEETIEIQSFSDNIYQPESKQKKKKDEAFDLKWTDDELQKFIQLNGKIDVSKEKLDPNYLLVELQKNQIQYQKCFEKNIKGKKNFPPSLKQLPLLAQKFQKKFFYNELSDRQYEEFYKKYNKKTVMEKFIKSAPYIFSDTYSSDYDSNNINIAKMFLTQDGLQNDKMIYKINSRKMIPTSNLQHKSIFNEEQLLQLSFLVRKYVGQFGNNWKLICSFVSTHPAFSQMSLTLEQIQEYHQIVRQRQNTNGQLLRLWNSRVLPFKSYGSSVYQEYSLQKKTENCCDENTMQKDDDEIQQKKQIDLLKYKQLIDQPLIEELTEKSYAFEKTQKSFENLVKNSKTVDIISEKITLAENTKETIQNFESKNDEIKTSYPKTDHGKWTYQNVLQILATEKSDIKIGCPFRKRKNINDKTSQLVKILQLLKNKFGGTGTKPNNPTNPPKPGTGQQSFPNKSIQQPKKEQNKPKTTPGVKVQKEKQQHSAEKQQKSNPKQQTRTKKKKGQNDQK